MQWHDTDLHSRSVSPRHKGTNKDMKDHVVHYDSPEHKAYRDRQFKFEQEVRQQMAGSILISNTRCREQAQSRHGERRHDYNR